MGAFRKINKNLREVKRINLRPNYRGNGYGKLLLDKLLKVGKEFGCSRILLDTGPFMNAAQHV
jgi:GNAT superfamily N-acetyltransferase